MKVWATSDIHVDFPENLEWFTALSGTDYTEDILILAGDVIHDLNIMRNIFRSLKRKFHEILFVPGNHDLWLWKSEVKNSMVKFEQVMALAAEEGIQTTPHIREELTIVPLFSWYDFSFGQPSPGLQAKWNDFKVCNWPMDLSGLTGFFHQMNEEHLGLKNKYLISFSHFMPDRSLIPSYVPQKVKDMLPVFGSRHLGKQVKRLKPDLHIYGHSHLNRRVKVDGIRYVNNAFGYPHEEKICRKELICVYEADKID